jgi:hypothetical protein
VGEYDAPSTFPALRLPALDGGERALAEAWQGNPAVILVGHSGCDTTRFTLPFVERLHRGRAAGTVLAVLQDEPADARALAERLGLTLPVLLDREPYALVSALAMPLVPVVFLVGEGGGVERASEAFRRDDLQGFADRLGVQAPFFRPDEKVPALRPG